MNILLIDDHELFRSGLKSLLLGLQPNDLQEELCFIEAGTCTDALAIDGKDDIELVLLDLHLPDISGVEAFEKIKQSFVGSIVALSSEDDSKVIRDVIEHGADGFIPKSSSPSVLIAALRLVLAKGIYLPPHILDDYGGDKQAKQSQEEHRQAILGELTDRQLNVLSMAVQGKSNKSIARELHIAEGTVKAHLSACYRVLNVKNRTAAVAATTSIDLLRDR